MIKTLFEAFGRYQWKRGILKKKSCLCDAYRVERGINNKTKISNLYQVLEDNKSYGNRKM